MRRRGSGEVIHEKEKTDGREQLGSGTKMEKKRGGATSKGELFLLLFCVGTFNFLRG